MATQVYDLSLFFGMRVSLLRRGLIGCDAMSKVRRFGIGFVAFVDERLGAINLVQGSGCMSTSSKATIEVRYPCQGLSSPYFRKARSACLCGGRCDLCRYFLC